MSIREVKMWEIVCDGCNNTIAWDADFKTREDVEQYDAHCHRASDNDDGTHTCFSCRRKARGDD